MATSEIRVEVNSTEFIDFKVMFAFIKRIKAIIIVIIKGIIYYIIGFNVKVDLPDFKIIISDSECF